MTIIKNYFEKIVRSVERVAQLLEDFIYGKQVPYSCAKCMAHPDPIQETLPEHVTVSWIVDYLQIDPSTFYRNINKKVLFPVFYVGKRPYFLKEDVIKLMRPHDKNAHTYSRYRKKGGL